MSKIFLDVTPLKVSPAFRRLWLGNSLSSIGTQMTIMTVSLQVYAQTSSSFSVGLLGIFTVVPLVIAGLYGGAVADAHDRRQVALYSTLVLWIVSVLLAAGAWIGISNVWWLYILMAVHSGASGINQPTRGAIIPQLVGTKLLPSANSLNMLTFSIAMMLGPVLGGLLVANYGYQWTYTIDAVTFAASVWSVYRLPSMPSQLESAVRGLKSVKEGFAYLATQPDIRMTFIIDLVAMILAAPRVLLPALAAVALGGGETTVGLLMAAVAIGAMIVGLFSGMLNGIRHQGRAVFVGVCVWGLSMSGLGLAAFAALQHGGAEQESYLWLGLALLSMLIAGIADSVSAIFRTTILQSAAPDHMRGRLQGVFIVVVAGGPHIGGLLAGASSAVIGESWTLIVGGLLCVLVAALLMRWQPSFWAYDATRIREVK
ncbi:MFS transporter [Glutamicibacter sp.]|uniref:MFS transporter n=1 Tax=Glutamicibacter sp. TaxID=1931995 RepID=UPI0028BE13C0|nr:MFS transporter [Glutamicibacter sp.]